MDSRGEPPRMAATSDSPGMVGGQTPLNSYPHPQPLPQPQPQPLQSTPMSIPNPAAAPPAPTPTASVTTMPPAAPMHLSFAPAQHPPPPAAPPGIPKPVESPGSAYNGETSLEMRHSIGVSATEPMMRKKRGRPRKYGPDGSVTLALTPAYSASEHAGGHPGSDPSGKKRGRPPGSGKKQQLEALGPFGTGFTAHVITVNPGEDVASTVLAFSQQGPRTVCILSANGVISNVALRQPASYGGTVTYEGRFEIISLSGSYLLTEDAGTRSRSGGLSVALAGSDGRVLGGGVAGVLTAATPVQVILGSFIAEGKKPKQPEPIKIDPPPVSQPQYPGGFGGPPVVSPHQSEGSASESSEEEDLGSPPNHGIVAYNHSVGQQQHQIQQQLQQQQQPPPQQQQQHPQQQHQQQQHQQHQHQHPPSMPPYTLNWGQPMGQQRQ